MTAQKVGTLVVIADEPTASPDLRDSAGGVIFWQRTRTLLLEDGSTVYGCSVCDYTSPNMRSIRPHLQKHSRRVRATDPPRSEDPASLGEQVRAQLLAARKRVTDAEADRDRWRARAQKAEKALATMRRALTS